MTTHHLSGSVSQKHNDADIISQCCQPIGQKLTFKRVVSKFKKGYQNWRTRRQLMNISAAGMKDLGITKSDVYHEIEKPFWK